jgi:trk system potassium uptake protein TrkH
VAAGGGAAGLWLLPRPNNALIRPVAGFGAVTLAWSLATLAGAVPFLLAGTFSSPIDGAFEAMSGFSTTGASLLTDIEAEPDAVLMWRSIMQWIGGVGIVLVVVVIAPIARIGLQRVFYAEVSGITADRLTPRIADTAKIIAGIYLAFSVAAVIAFALAGMSFFDAVNHSMTSVATGGFSTKNLSIAAFDSVAIELVAMVFMTLSAINFAIYWRLVRRRRAAPQLSETIAFLAILAAAVVVVTVSLELAGDSSSFFDGLRDASFSVVSVMTTTGFTTADFDVWNEFVRFTFLGLMIVGACAGSTSGGMKVIRVVLLGRAAAQELQRHTQPNAVRVLRLGGRTFPEEVRTALLNYLLVYVIVFFAGCVAFAICGLAPASSIGATAATLNNIGPGLGDVGAIENFTSLPAGGRVVATILMLAGRLEIFTVLALLTALVVAVTRRR